MINSVVQVHLIVLFLKFNDQMLIINHHLSLLYFVFIQYLILVKIFIIKKKLHVT